MKILIGTYNKNIYNLEVIDDKIKNIKILNEAIKPSYLVKGENLAYLHNINNIQHLKIGDENLNLSQRACHLSYDNIHKLFYVSFYHDGILKVIGKSEKWEIIETKTYEKHSKIHYANFIKPLNLLGVCDLGDNKFFLYEINDKKLVFKTSYSLKNFGPRHFVYHKTKPIIYIINELVASISVLKYENGALSEIQNIKLSNGAAAAIRITDDNKYLLASVRDSNFLFSFQVERDGTLNLIQKISTYGDHPRDFNLILNDSYVLLANMHSDNLTLYSLKDGILTLKDYDVFLEKGSCVIEY